jgi:hypothetical protein
VKTHNNKENHPMQQATHPPFIRAIVWSATLLLPLLATAQQPCLKQAWDAYNAKRYPAAMQAADDCIDQFAARAQRDQADLVRTHVPLPKTGTVTDAEKTAIFARGILNDTGAAYFVKGRSAEYLAQKGAKEKYLGIAREAYHQCATLTYARTFDTPGWFWSTAEACNDRLDAITRQPKGGDTTPAPRPK